MLLAIILALYFVAVILPKYILGPITKPNLIPPINTYSDFPVKPNTNGVSSISMLYTFKGKITHIDKNKDALILTLDTQNPSFPTFRVERGANIYYVQNGKFVPQTFDTLLPGISVSINMSYDILSKSWILMSVIVPPPAR